MSIMQTENLSVAAGGATLIAGLNWQVERGQLWCVLGQNGVGKTSLLYTLCGLAPPSKGQLLIDGASMASLAPDVLAFERGFMPQQQIDSFSMTAMAAVLVGRTPHRLGSAWDSDEDRRVASAALAAVGLTHKAGMDVLTLSAGERQRIALAALLAQAPQLMLMDEPAAHQDVAQQLAMMRLIRGLTDRHAVISSCHDIDLAARFATHVLVLAEGRHWIGTAEQVLTVEVLEQAFDCRFEEQTVGGVRSFMPY
jgi:iron complex transport system ATP-binding protein